MAAKVKTPTAVALRAVVAQPTVAPAVLMAAGRYAVTSCDGELLRMVCAHPSLSRQEAAAVAGLNGPTPWRPDALAGYLRRRDVTDQDVLALRHLFLHGRQYTPLILDLVEDPDTTELVLNAAVSLVRRLDVGGWRVLGLLTHPNATGRTAVTAFIHLSSPGDNLRTLAARCNTSASSLTSRVRALRPALAQDVFDALDHPELLTVLATTHLDLLADTVRQERFAQVVFLSAGPGGKVSASHRLARAAKLLAECAPVGLRTAVADHLTEHGYVLAGASPHQVLGVPTPVDLAADIARLSRRSWSAVCKAAGRDAGTATTLAALLAQLAEGDGGADRMLVWSTVADHHDGTVGELLAAVTTAAAHASSA